MGVIDRPIPSKTIEVSLTPDQVMERFRQNAKLAGILQETSPEEWYADSFYFGEVLTSSSFYLTYHGRSRTPDGALFNGPIKMTVNVCAIPGSTNSALTLSYERLLGGKLSFFAAILAWILTIAILGATKKPLIALFPLLIAILATVSHFRPLFVNKLKQELLNNVLKRGI